MKGLAAYRFSVGDLRATEPDNSAKLIPRTRRVARALTLAGGALPSPWAARPNGAWGRSAGRC